MNRVYLDYNASAPLREEAREAMVHAMALAGNPSSVHAEGRQARAIVETARQQVAAALGAQGADVIFTSGATEAAGLALTGRGIRCADIEHEAVSSWCQSDLSCGLDGGVACQAPGATALQLANSETGILQQLPDGLALCDMTQAFGKLPVAFHWSGATMALVSAHKIGGPKGVGALIVKRGTEVAAQIKGGGQEMGRRSGTENVIGIAGFGAAAEAAQRDLADGVWEQVEKLRNILEKAVAQSASETIFVGQGGRRLPNTSYMISEGWRGETQVMQMDLAGFSVSAGSACSSGKVKRSRVLQAMGFSAEQAACALRVSLGPQNKLEDIERFVEVWGAHQHRLQGRRRSA